MTRAAKRLGVSAPTLSRQLADLEARVGQRLLHRTSKSLSATEAGLRFFEVLKPCFDQLCEQIAQLEAEREEIAGPIRIACPETLFLDYLHERLCLFLEKHPKVNIHVSYALTEASFVENRIDLAVVVAPPRDGRLSQVKLVEQRSSLVASPSYLARAGQILELEQLADQDHLALAFQDHWYFSRDGEMVSVPTRVRYSCESMKALVDAAVRGIGIALVPDYFTDELVRSGQLMRVLPDAAVPATGLYLVSNDRKLLPTRIAALKAFLIDQAKAFELERDRSTAQTNKSSARSFGPR